MARQLRVSLIQPGVPKYRVPVFARLAEAVDLCIAIYANPDSVVPEVEPTGFKSQAVRVYPFGNGKVVWVPSEIRLATQDRSEVLILPWNLRVLSSLPALLRARWNGVRTILWGHGYSRRSKSATMTLFRNTLARVADAVMVYDYQTADWLGSRLGPRTQVFVAPNALDQVPIRAQREYLREHSGLLDGFAEENGLVDRDVILHVSRLIPARRLDVLVQAMSVLRDSRPSVLLVVIGDGPEKLGLQQRASDLDLGELIRFVPPTYDERELALWFSTARAYCFPEGIGLSIFHAMGYGVPVVVGDDLERHWPEARSIKWNENAIGFEHGDSRSLAHTLNELLSNQELHDKLVVGGLSTVAESFNADIMVRSMVVAIRGVTG